jgi:hypothetical protein
MLLKVPQTSRNSWNIKKEMKKAFLAAHSAGILL